MKERSRLKQLMQKRAMNSPEGDHNSNWAISYGDMITLLLAFFVLFFSLGSENKEVEIFESMVQEEFGEDQQQKADVSWGRVESKSKSVGKTQGNSGSPAKEGDQVSMPAIKTTIQGNKLLVEFPQVSFFETAQTTLTPEGLEVLGRFAEKFKNFSGTMRLIVRGYTDNRPVKASSLFRFQDNLELSALRAISALRELNGKGIPFHRMRIGGYGEADKSQELSAKDLLRYDRKIVLVVEPLDKTERGAELEKISRTPASANPPFPEYQELKEFL